MIFLAALRHDRIDAPWFIEGPIDGVSFRTFLEKVLLPVLDPAILSSWIASVATGANSSPAHPFGNRLYGKRLGVKAWRNTRRQQGMTAAANMLGANHP